ncbi:class I SAM-dependent methyltransferase [Sphingomonas bacterium]|uniref:class I SAM-dependent methyltransferase n=1 Tax=Sphingomonas bacterium TaxID=1895847 RepID=UPI00157542CE|nr:class I SAM-dependent methyltransferase [Sphingomonas bacterium]
MTGQAGDTYARSCDHWSEASRAEMDAFYALATDDYRHLAEAKDWATWLADRQRAAGNRPLRLLDVACGSGKFPTALRRHAGVEDAGIGPIDYDLLDPSAFSIAEARAALGLPFVPAAEFETPLQGFTTPDRPYDIVWATHALYAVPLAELDAAMEAFVRAIGGIGFIANAMADSHYIRFYRVFLDSFRGGEGEAYRTGEEIAASLRRLGASVEVQEVAYSQKSDDDAVVEGYLQRCAFDDTVPLASMRSTGPLAAYLEGCRSGGGWRFEQRVAMLFVTP